jgi:hypothetical protein
MKYTAYLSLTVFASRFTVTQFYLKETKSGIAEKFQ